MTLKGKAKEAFEKWFDDYSQEHHQKEWLDNDLYLDEVYLPDEIINALIIEWLDSVGIYVEVGYLHAYKEWHRDVSTKTGSCYIRGWETRQQATKKAIERAIEIYNEKHK